MIFKTLFSCLIFLSTGCTSTFPRSMQAQSHFDFPNSNVHPLGAVKGRDVKESFLIFHSDGYFDYGKRERHAIEDALSKKPGAEMLINYVSLIRTFRIPFIYDKETYEVEGTAVSATIGKQILE